VNAWALSLLLSFLGILVRILPSERLVLSASSYEVFLIVKSTFRLHLIDCQTNKGRVRCFPLVERCQFAVRILPREGRLGVSHFYGCFPSNPEPHPPDQATETLTEIERWGGIRKAHRSKPAHYGSAKSWILFSRRSNPRRLGVKENPLSETRLFSSRCRGFNFISQVAPVFTLAAGLC